VLLRRRAIVIAVVILSAGPAAGHAWAARTTPAGWGITPAGRLILNPTPDGAGLPGPWAVKISPDGRWALVTSSGSATKRETVEMYDIGSGARTALQVYHGRGGKSVFYGLAFSPDGKRAWASGGGQGVVHSFRVMPDGRLLSSSDIKAGHYPSGIAFAHTPLGDRLYVADNLGAAPFSAGSYEDPPGDSVLVIDPDHQSTKRIDLGTAHFPFGVAFNRSGTSAYVTNWTGRSVTVIDTATERPVRDILLSPISNPLQADHPSAIAGNPKQDEMYTANANSDTVSVIDTATNRLAATIDVSLVPGAPKGAMPEGLAVSPDGRTLYVALAGENAVAVVDLQSRHTRGFIPTAWYPADVAVTPDGRRLVVANTNGLGAGPNPCGPFTPLPVLQCPEQHPALYGGYPEAYYIGTMIRGALQVIDLPAGQSALTTALANWTRQVRSNNHVTVDAPLRPRYLNAVDHVIYVIKENRTYDQVFGDLEKGNGDPDLTLFKDDSAPNHRELARRFVLLDNFYVDAEVSQDGHPWSTQATASDYVDKTWPFDYGWAYYRTYSSEFVPLAQQFRSEPLASDPTVPRSAAAATAGYIWDNAYDHGVSFRDYGEGTPWDDPNNCHSGESSSDLTRLRPRFGDHVAPGFPGWNIECSDHAVRLPAWEREFRQYEQNGKLPQLEIVYLPSDHTNGTTAGEATPASYMADNDLALGKLVEDVSHSQYWQSTAIIVLEDDAQDGPDHVDTHRSPALVISPYTQHGLVDSTHYSTSSALATIEDLLGLSPMSIFDQRATRMWASFSPWPNMRTYTAIQPTVTPFGDPGAPRNAPGAHLAAASAAQNWAVPDGPDKQVLNAAIWWSIKGDTPMPEPRSAFADPDE